jgi:dihydropyrimidinase
MSLLWHHGVNGGRITASRFVELTATNPARVFGLYPRKGTLAPGSDADIVLWDPNRERKISAQTSHAQIDHSLYEGWTVRGAPAKVFLRGRLLVDGEQWHGAAGTGRFLRRGRSMHPERPHTQGP